MISRSMENTGSESQGLENAEKPNGEGEGQRKPTLDKEEGAAEEDIDDDTMVITVHAPERQRQVLTQ